MSQKTIAKRIIDSSTLAGSTHGKLIFNDCVKRSVAFKSGKEWYSWLFKDGSMIMYPANNQKLAHFHGLNYYGICYGRVSKNDHWTMNPRTRRWITVC